MYSAVNYMNYILNKMFQNKLVVIARRLPLEKVEKCTDALIRGGVEFIESTFDQSAPDCIDKNKKCIKAMINAANGKAFIGAGTVLNIEQVHAAYDAGAKYIISPNVNEDVIKETVRLGMISIPGAMTPTEIEKAYSFGADIVKLFPADDVGIHYIKNISAPLSHIPLMATGGVNPETIREYADAGIKAFGTGITILKPELVANNDYEAIMSLAKEHIDAIKSL